MALTSLLIISSLLLLVTLYSSTDIASAEQAFDRLYDKEQNRYTALSCIHEVLLRLSENNVYAGNETISLATDPSESCIISTITHNETFLSFSAQVTGEYSKTILQATVSQNFEIKSITQL